MDNNNKYDRYDTSQSSLIPSQIGKLRILEDRYKVNEGYLELRKNNTSFPTNLSELQYHYYIEPGEINSLPQGLQHIFQRETCPVCFQYRTSSKSNDKEPIYILCCKLLACFHIVHQSCIISSKNSILQYPHTTRSFRILHRPFALRPNFKNSTAGTRCGCFFSVSFFHMISDDCIMTLFLSSSTNPRAQSLIDNVTGLEYLFYHKNSKCATQVLPTSRGRIVFEGSCQSTGEKWFYEAFYDFQEIESEGLTEDNVTQLGLVLSDSRQDICLTILVDMIPDSERTISICQPAWRVSDIYFELHAFKSTKSALHNYNFSSKLSAYASPFVLPTESSQVTASFTENYVKKSDKSNKSVSPSPSQLSQKSSTSSSAAKTIVNTENTITETSQTAQTIGAIKKKRRPPMQEQKYEETKKKRAKNETTKDKRIDQKNNKKSKSNIKI